MKTAMLALFFLLFALSTKPQLGAARPDPVLDISGQIVRPGVAYHILPVLRGRGGGLTIGNSGNNTCPLFVVQEHVEIFNGQPVTFSPAIYRNNEVHTSSDLNIKFSSSENACGQSTVWKLLKELSGVWFVSTGGVEGNPGLETLTNWFKIELAGNDYKLAFCPTVIDGPTICRELGVFIGDDKKRHLALADETQELIVMFKKAETEPLISIVSN